MPTFFYSIIQGIAVLVAMFTRVKPNLTTKTQRHKELVNTNLFIAIILFLKIEVLSRF
jgi:hypothetical protein